MGDGVMSEKRARCVPFTHIRLSSACIGQRLNVTESKLLVLSHTLHVLKQVASAIPATRFVWYLKKHAGIL